LTSQNFKIFDPPAKDGNKPISFCAGSEVVYRSLANSRGRRSKYFNKSRATAFRLHCSDHSVQDLPLVVAESGINYMQEHNNEQLVQIDSKYLNVFLHPCMWCKKKSC